MRGKLKIAALQWKMGRAVKPEEFDRLQDQGVDIASLPEYFFVPENAKNQADTSGESEQILDSLAEYSRRLNGVLIGGTLIEQEGSKLYNACHLFERGRHVGFYRKMHPMPGERQFGVAPGDEYKVFEVKGINLGILVCSDVFFPESFHEIARLKAHLIANPTDSPYLSHDTVAEKQRRDREIYVNGARIASAVILKTCGVGMLAGKQLQGRSLICDRHKIIAGVDPSREGDELELIADVDFDKT